VSSYIASPQGFVAPSSRARRVADLLIFVVALMYPAAIETSVTEPGMPAQIVNLRGATPTAQQDPLRTLDTLRAELQASQRILATLRQHDSLFAERYLDDLEGAFRRSEGRGDDLLRSAPMFVQVFSAARADLLDKAPTARAWIRLARAVDPDGKLSLPRRYVGAPRRMPGLELDIDSLRSIASVDRFLA
jgi:hypothetical protein